MQKKKIHGFAITLLVFMLIFVLFSGCIQPTEYMVEMRDGIHLATDVYLPNNLNSAHGTILIRTPYNKNDATAVGTNLAKNGWPAVIQDMRGRYSSEGIDTVFRNAHTDGPDTLAWIAQQSWSNGKIATFGGSALGINQYYMAGTNPPNLACQYISVATPNLYEHGVYQGGQFRKYLVEEWLRGQGSLFVLPELWSNENYSLDFWTNTSLEDNWESVNVPAIHLGGWYDCFEQGIIDGFMGYQYVGGSGALGKSKLIMGPWSHGLNRHVGELVYPENADYTAAGETFVEMINQYCMNGPDDFDNRPVVSYYVMGDVDDIDAPGNEWRTAEDWPLPHTELECYFHGDGSLSTSYPTDYAPLSYFYDPTDPVPTLGGQNLGLPRGPYDQSPVEDREDVLVFTSDVLLEPFEATGPIKARLYVSSDCPDTDFTVKLTDVYPDGRSMLITDGIIRMRNRNGFDHWEFMQPGEIYEVEVDVWSTSYIWNTGHRVRVAISSSNYPRFLNNPNTADPIYGNTTYNVAENVLYMDGEHPSCIILPVPNQVLKNDPPVTPSIPQGKNLCLKQETYSYTTFINDPEGDPVYLLFDWDDGTSSGWMGPFESGENVSLEHTWAKEGEYRVRVKAKDSTGSQSLEWSEILDIKVTQGAISSKQILKTTIQRLKDKFPILSFMMDNTFDSTNLLKLN